MPSKFSVHLTLTLCVLALSSAASALYQPIRKPLKTTTRKATAVSRRVYRVTISPSTAPRLTSDGKFGARPASAARGERMASTTLSPGVITPTRTTAPPAADDVADNPHAATYWYDPRIHNWGNIGLGGRLHAFFAPLFTAIIDRASYKLPNGGFLDVRKKVLSTIPKEATVLDLACGTGFSTAPGATGLDTSNEMLDVARFRRPDCKFVFGNAESYGEDASFDVVTMMFATHEMPAFGRRRVLRNAMRVARKEVIVCDIDPDFEETLAKKPLKGATFLSGEPYVLDYLRRMDDDVKSCAPVRFAFTKDGTAWTATREVLLKGHVVTWRLTRTV